MKTLSFTLASSAALLAVIFPPSLGFADSPLPAPAMRTIWSANRQFYAIIDPGKQITTIYRTRQEGQGDKVWSMYGWFRVASLADDGKHLVVGYDGINLLALDYDKQQVMLYFFERGELISYVTLDRLIQDFSKLERTVSHYSWGNFVGFNRNGNYVIETVEGRQIRFDVTRGGPILERPSK